MGAPTIPFYGKDSDRLAKLAIAYKALADSGAFLENWPTTVATPALFKARIDSYQEAFQDAVHCDRRAIAQRVAAGDSAGVTWQKIVNYACSTEQDNTALLDLMGVTKRHNGAGNVQRDLYAPDFGVANLEQRGGVRAFCPYERRRLTYDVWMTEGDPRVEDGWYHKASFGDCTKMDMFGYQPGQEVSFRCRIIAKDNSVGPWSHTITIMVT